MTVKQMLKGARRECLRRAGLKRMGPGWYSQEWGAELLIRDASHNIKARMPLTICYQCESFAEIVRDSRCAECAAAREPNTGVKIG